MKAFLKKYSHIWVFLYLPVYMIWFSLLEQTDDVKFTYMHSFLDDYIPFCEAFIIPYLLWFLYVASTVVVLFFCTKHKEDFYRYFLLLALGMTIALVAYTFFPTSQHLRPSPMPRYNFFTRIIMLLYQVDTSTNVCPSIHVFNSIATHIAITHSHFFKQKKKLQAASFILCVLICISTVTLKQHSIIDGIVSIALIFILYPITYGQGFNLAESPKAQIEE